MNDDKLILYIMILLFVIIISGIAIAVPSNPDSISVSDSERRTQFGGESVQTLGAQAGNVTELTVTSTTNSKRWQGYYGNISGTITLDNAQNWTLYEWVGDISPQGEILAADAQVSNWSGLICANLSALYRGYNCSESPNGQCLNLTELQDKFGGPYGGGESVNATFTSTANIQLDTGLLQSCPSTNSFSVGSAQAKNWTEVLLMENKTETVVFASIINASTLGFDNTSWDFQMIVGDDGDDLLTTTYYFYVELS